MARQNGERIVHFDNGDGSVCWLAGETAELSTDPRETTCGRCLKIDVWTQAWRAEAKRAKVPTR